MKVRDRKIFDRRLSVINWDKSTGIEPAELEALCRQIVVDGEKAGKHHHLITAEIYKTVLEKAQLEMEPANIFAGKCNLPGRVLSSQITRNKWIWQDCTWKDEWQSTYDAGCFRAWPDFDHCTINWDYLMDNGVSGILAKIAEAREARGASGTLDEGVRAFYDSCEIAINAVRAFIIRLAGEADKAAALSPKHEERMTKSARCLRNLASAPPQSLYEAMQLGCLYYLLNYELEMPLNSLGGIDRIYGRFYRSDIEKGIIDKREAMEIVEYFLLNCRTGNQSREYAGKHSNNIGNSFFIGGADGNGNSVVTEFTYMVLEAYRRINVVVPKISVRLDEKTPAGFMRKLLINMRDRNMHYVLLNDRIAVKALMKVGISEKDAYEYAPIGCYEPSVVGKEIGCTGWPFLSMPKAVELTLYNGSDPQSGIKAGIETGDCGDFKTFDEFYNAVKRQLKFLLEGAMQLQRKIEYDYPKAAATPLMSSTMPESIMSGVDAYSGGAEYSNSSVTAGGLAEIVDSLSVINEFVYRRRKLSITDFREILCKNWEGNESLRTKCVNYKAKWGNGKPEPDKTGMEICKLVAETVNNRENGRGGVFKAAMIGIILRRKEFGNKLGALPSGRYAHDPLPSHINANTNMDRAGITGLINSVTKIDHSDFPNGSVTDIMLHPSAVRGKDGLAAFGSIIRTYFSKGGFALQFNIFDVETLRDAQQHPEKYQNLQIRISGWNVLFVNLCKEEQDMFIKQFENIS